MPFNITINKSIIRRYYSFGNLFS